MLILLNCKARLRLVNQQKTQGLQICNQPVAGSSPIASSIYIKGLGVFHLGLFYFESPQSHQKKWRFVVTGGICRLRYPAGSTSAISINAELLTPFLFVRETNCADPAIECGRKWIARSAAIAAS
ncbi:hypothetical protein [Methylomonas koyamae]|uniref:hypothetical protein n=1 Tax=Methylomonas koyamae TaxID=702114 RepID=UPI0012FE4FBA|nr:hypothetical protein [Methylomonas koyamae]